MTSKDIRSQLGFTEKDIAIIARRPQHVSLVEKSIITNRKGIEKLFALGFRPSNISAVLAMSGGRTKETV